MLEITKLFQNFYHKYISQIILPWTQKRHLNFNSTQEEGSKIEKIFIMCGRYVSKYREKTDSVTFGRPKKINVIK